MDPFSAFSSAISVLDIAIRASKALYGLYTELVGAPELILALSNETADISVVLGRVGEARKTLDRLDTLQNATFLAALDGHIFTAKVILSRLDILATELRSQTGSIKRVKWCLRKNKANGLKDELRAVRQRINEILVAHSATISARVELELQGVYSSIRQNHVATVEQISMLSQTTSSQIASIYTASRQRDGKLIAGYPGQEGVGVVVDTLPPTYESASTSYQTSISGAETSQRITAIETTLSSLLAEVSALGPSREKPPTAMHHRSGMRSQVISRPSSSHDEAIIYFALRSKRSGCASDCPCRCHLRTAPDTSWALPRALEGLVGLVFVGYAGFPVGRSACDTESCSRAHTFKFQVTYAFPVWFLRHTLHAFVEASTLGTLTVSLTVRRRVPFQPGGVLALAMGDDKEAIRIKLEADRASLLDVDERDGQSLLHLATYRPRPNVEIIRMLLQMGADPDYEDHHGRTPRRIITLAVLNNSLAAAPGLVAEIEALLPARECLDDLGFTYIHKLVCGVYPIPLESALERLGPKRVQEQINESSKDGSTALHLAAKRRNSTAIVTLLRAGASVDAPDKLGATALLWSAQLGEEACIDVLLRAGADARRTDHEGHTVLHHAAHTPNLNIVKKFVARGLDPNQPIHRWGVTALSYAAMYHRTETVRYLYQQGAKLDAADRDGDTPLYYSIYEQLPGKGHETFALLLELGADHLVVNESGNTLLHIIALAGNVETMKVAAEKKLSGLSIHAKNKDGLMPLEIFEQRRNLSDKLKEAFDRLLQSVETFFEPAVQNEKADLDEEVSPKEGEGLDEDEDIFEDALEKLGDEEPVAVEVKYNRTTEAHA